MTTRREWINPLDYIRDQMGIAEAGEWITFDPKVDYQYRIIRQQSHDGLVAFTEELIARALLPLVTRTSFYKPAGEPDKFRHYVVGWLRLATAYGMVDLPCGRYPGQRERLTIPVRTIEPAHMVSAGYVLLKDGTLQRYSAEPV